MKIKICYHGNCFDGVSSAAVFGRFYREKIHADWEQAFQPMMHRAGALFDEDAFDGDENAIVDFKYSASEKLTWWFDHHKSAFLTPEDEAHFKAYTGGKKFLDADYKSCTKFIADTTAKHFGFDPAPMSELIHWANVIDSAAYQNAAEPVEMEAPAFKLALVIECDRDPALAMKIILDLQTRTMQEVAASPYVQERIAPLYQRHLQAIETIKAIVTVNRDFGDRTNRKHARLKYVVDVDTAAAGALAKQLRKFNIKLEGKSSGSSNTDAGKQAAQDVPTKPWDAVKDEFAPRYSDQVKGLWWGTQTPSGR